MRLIKIAELPCVPFGRDICREIRLVASPWTTGSDITIVHATLPPGSVSEGHSHPDADEYIHFDIGGSCEVDGVIYPVPPDSVIQARRGEWHEARNTSTDQVLTLYCVFCPAFRPYGAYPELIERTQAFFQPQNGTDSEEAACDDVRENNNPESL